MRAELLKFLERREERVTLGGMVLVIREMPTAGEMSELAGEDSGFRLVVRCVFDEDGAPLFTDEDIPVLKGLSKTKFSPVAAAVNRVNGWDAEAEVKNSAAAAN